MSKREMAAQVLGRSFTRLLLRPAGARQGELRILAYHRVLDDYSHARRFDEDLVSASTECFYDQMRFARSNFDVISFRDLYECEIGGRRWPDRALIVTFDDGYRDNYTHAFPVLKELGLPATIFLVTDHIGRAKLFWWDLIAYCVKHTERRSFCFAEVSPVPMRLTTASERRKIILTLLGWIKQVPEHEKRRFLEKLPRELDVEIPESVAEGMHLSWEEVKIMAAGGIEFGSHTSTHPLLSNVDAAQLEHELCESKKAIEDHLGQEALTLSYPVGGFNISVQEAAVKCGFRYAVSYEDGITSRSDFDRFGLPRIHVERNESLRLFRAKLMFPDLMLRNLTERRERMTSVTLNTMRKCMAIITG